MKFDSRRPSIRASRLGWLLISTFFVLLPCFSGCSEDPNPLGFDSGPAGGSFTRPETLLVAAPSSDTEHRPIRETSTATSLLVGNDSTAAMRALIKFDNIPDTSGMNLAYLRLHVRRGQGGPVTLTVRRILGGSDSWTASTVTFETPIDTSEVIAQLAGVATGTAPETFSQLDYIPIPMDIVREWRRDTDTNAGLILSISEGSGIARFVSQNDVILDDDGVGIPTPQLVLAADTTLATTRSARATTDAYVYESHRPEPGPSDPTVHIGSGPPMRTLMRFDVSSLPEEISIVNATLRMPQFESAIDSLRVSVYNVTEEWSETAVPDSLKLAAVPSDSRLFKGAPSALKLDIGAIVQAWVDRKATNYGVAVRFADELGAPQSILLSTREYPDPARRPSLEVVFLRASTSPPWGGEQ